MLRLFAVLVLALAFAGTPLAQEGPKPTPHWARHDPTSMKAIDHGAWEQFLTRYVRIGADGVHRVAYGEVTPDDRGALDRHIAELAALPITTYNRDQQMAFWINLHNALLVRLILDHYPVASVLDIDGQPRRSGPWHLPLVEVDERRLSLADIQHRILGSVWEDARMYYALSCGALGCPDLQPVPFKGQSLDEQLTEAAIDYANDSRCMRFEEDRLIVSSIYRWYRDDFGGSDRAVISHLLALAEPSLAMRLQDFDHISGDAFDWRLNDATLP
jgi:hypothetical protein